LPKESLLMSSSLRRLVRVVVAMMWCAAVPALVHAQDKPVTASDGWIKLPADGETSTTAFATVSNPGMYAIYVVSATSDVATKIELRDAQKGAAPVDDIAVLQYETTAMDPKGGHLLLSGLKRPLKEGEKIWITLKLDTQDEVQVEAVVKK
jgi:copper(I)-binding protein